MEIIDTQLHIARLVTERLSGGRRPDDSDAPAWYHPAFPIFTAPTAETVLAGTLVAMDAVGIDAVIIDEWLGMDSTGHQVPNTVTARGSRRYPNELGDLAVRRYPERFGYLARVDPLDGEIDDVVAQLSRSPGLVYLRADPLPWAEGQVERFRSGGYTPVFRAASKVGLPVSLWMQPDDSAAVERYLEAFPDIAIILDHAIRYVRSDALFQLGARFPNLVLKWDGVETASEEVFPYADMWPYVERALETFGPQRIMWSSDWTEHKLQHSWAESLWWLRGSDRLTTHEKEWIFGRTARTVLNWPGSSADRLFLDCAMVHAAMRISGASEDEFIANMINHIDVWHPGRQEILPQKWLARARRPPRNERLAVPSSNRAPDLHN